MFLCGLTKLANSAVSSQPHGRLLFWVYVFSSHKVNGIIVLDYVHRECPVRCGSPVGEMFGEVE